MDDLPIEMIETIIYFMDYLSWFNFCKTSKINYEKFFEKNKILKINENYCYGKRYVVIDEIKYYLDPKPTDEKYIYCNDCSVSVKLKKIANHKKKCTKTKQLLCEYCLAPQKFHTKQNRQYVCKLMTKYCKYCDKVIPYPVFHQHKLICRNILINCLHCSRFICKKEIYDHNGWECTEHIISCNICRVKYKPRNYNSIYEHSKICFGKCSYCEQIIPGYKYFDHRNNTCPKLTKECGHCKEVYVHVTDKDLHLTCLKKCGTCGDIIPRNLKGLHEKYDCTDRDHCILINCDKCGRKVYIFNIQEHLNDCDTPSFSLLKYSVAPYDISTQNIYISTQTINKYLEQKWGYDRVISGK